MACPAAVVPARGGVKAASTVAVSPAERGDRQAEPGEDAAVQEARGVGPLGTVLVVFEAEPFQAGLGHQPDQVLAHAVAAIGPALVAQVNRGGTGRHFHDQFRRAGEVAVFVHAGEAAVFGQAAEEGVGLHGVLGVEDDRGVGEHLGLRVAAGVGDQPALNQGVGFGVADADG